MASSKVFFKKLNECSFQFYTFDNAIRSLCSSQPSSSTLYRSVRYVRTLRKRVGTSLLALAHTAHTITALSLHSEATGAEEHTSTRCAEDQKPQGSWAGGSQFGHVVGTGCCIFVVRIGRHDTGFTVYGRNGGQVVSITDVDWHVDVAVGRCVR